VEPIFLFLEQLHYLMKVGLEERLYIIFLILISKQVTPEMIMASFIVVEELKLKAQLMLNIEIIVVRQNFNDFLLNYHYF
jgi:hypothetical protein